MDLTYTPVDYAKIADELTKIIRPTIPQREYGPVLGRLQRVIDHILSPNELPISPDALQSLTESTASGDHPEYIVKGRLYAHSTIIPRTRTHVAVGLTLPGEHRLVSQVNHIGQPTTGEEAVGMALEGLLRLYTDKKAGKVAKINRKGTESEVRYFYFLKEAA